MVAAESSGSDDVDSMQPVSPHSAGGGRGEQSKAGSQLAASPNHYMAAPVAPPAMVAPRLAQEGDGSDGSKESGFFEHAGVRWLVDRVVWSLKGLSSPADTRRWKAGLDTPANVNLIEELLLGGLQPVVFYSDAATDRAAIAPTPAEAAAITTKTLTFWRAPKPAPPPAGMSAGAFYGADYAESSSSPTNAAASAVPVQQEEEEEEEEPSLDAEPTGINVSDCLSDPISYLRLELECVYTPYMFAGSKSDIKWPRVVQHDTIRRVQKFTGLLQHFEGLVRGKVVLPLPPEMPATKAEVSTSVLEKKRRTIHLQETAIVEWSRHIRKVLDEESCTRLDHLEKAGIYPGATEELSFLAKKHEKLRHVVQQLSSPKVQAVISDLTRINSAYITSFDLLMDDLDAALVEARDLAAHLATLRRPLEILEASTFQDIPGNLVPVFHILSLVWYSSAHYNSRRLKVFFRMLSNTVVTGVTHYLTATDLFAPDSMSMVLQMLQDSLSVASQFKDLFFAYRTQVNAQHGKPWQLEETTVFGRVDAIIQRIRDLVEVFEIKSRFARLELFEPGGDHGDELQAVVKQVSQQFEKEALTWSHIVAGIIDPSSATFEAAYTRFITRVQGFDDRIALVVGKCFREKDTYQALKLLESIKDWKSAAIQVERDARLQELLFVMKNEVEVLFHRFECEKHLWDDSENGTSPLPNHLPWRTSLCVWVNGFLDRVRYQFRYLQQLSGRVFKSVEGQATLANANIFEETLVAWRESKLAAWKTQVTSLCLDRLDNTLLRRLGGTGLLVVNFDKRLAQALDDVWALQGFGVDLGHKVKSVFAQRDEFRLTIARLEAVASQYNHVVETVIEVERPLIRRALDAIHSILDTGLHEMTWRSPRVSEFVDNISRAVSTLHSNLIFLKGNINTVVKLLHNWRNMHKVVHFSEAESWESRKKGILSELTQLWQGEASPGLTDSERSARKWARKWRDRVSTRLRTLDDVLKQHRRIRRLVESGRVLLGVDPYSPAWAAYLEYVNHLFTTLFVAAVKKSLEHLLKYLQGVRVLDTYGRCRDATGVSAARALSADTGHLLSIKLMLRDGGAEFDPSIHRDDVGSVQYRVYEWCNTIFEVGRQLPRLDDPSNHYYVLLFEHPDLNVLKDEILRLMLSTIQKLEAVRMDFLKYSYLWQDEIDSYVERFATGRLLQHSEGERHVASPEPFENAFADADKADAEVGAGPAEYVLGGTVDKENEERALQAVTHKPSMEAYEAQVVKYEQLSDEIQRLPCEVKYGWITLDTSLIKAELVRLAHDWRVRFLNYEKRRLTTNISRFKEFVARTEAGIAVTSLETYQDLVGVMQHLARFHAHADHFDKMHEPSKEVVILLKKHDIALPSSVTQDVENAPVLWRDLKKKCFVVNELLSPRQMEEVAKIRMLEHSFERRSQQFHANTFQKKQPTALSVPPRLAYKAIAELHVMVLNLEFQLKDLQEKQQLFQLMPSPGRAVRSCRTDLMLLKYVWDATAYALYQLEAWNHVPCTVVNIEEMSERVQRLVTMITSLDKRVRRWEVYHEVEAQARNFLVSLPLIESLRTPAMRSVHWEDLMAKTGVHFDFKELTIENLISLNLHKFPEEVEMIVGKAVRQAQIEEQLASLENVWKHLALVFDTESGDHASFTVPNEVQVTIEEHQLVLQGLSQKQFVSEYLANVQQWQRTLATVEGVLSMLVEVHRTWRYLQSIFIGSEDIKAQLPQHTQLFLEIDTQVRALLREAARSPQIVQLCCNDGRETTLSSLLNQLAQCERALEGYMDQKRRAFPRFYFVSTPHLLEVLSRAGRDPQQLMGHIPRVFQEIEAFGLDGFLAVRVQGKGGESFNLVNSVLCTGRVEEWLQACADNVAATIFASIEQALLTYSGRSRLQWIEQHISQVALVASHIHWTVDVSSTFHAMEEGNEAALQEQCRRYDDLLQELVGLVPTRGLQATTRRRLTALVVQGMHHAEATRDLIRRKADHKNAFSWQRQLRHRLNEKARGVVAEICDCHFNYGGEYLGDEPRLVITPLTERVFISLTQAVRLKAGGALTGASGTGKTETVKDLAKHLGRPCYVFNGSDQMTCETLCSLFKGLASGGAWGCFEGFDRVRLPVLSVVALQFKRIFDAQKQNQKEFLIGADEVSLDPACALFVTVSVGGGGEGGSLPGSVTALFRPVAMAQPEPLVIAEHLLLSEGFAPTRVKQLARKFLRLFSLCRDLLSKQPHYDFGLRNVKAVLSVAGALKRSRPDVAEDVLLLQALANYNLPKIVPEDVDAFQSIVGDLLPGRALPSSKRREDFDTLAKKACAQLGCQPEEGLLAKCQQMFDLLQLRHCMIIVGAPATGKTTCRRVLFEAYKLQGRKYVDRVINPKSVTTAELFGSMDASNEWQDGLASSIIRSCAAMPPTDYACIVFDGDMDSAWTESLNSAMDDSRVLTLASNDRIQIPPNMVLLFESTSLAHATPASVSRAAAVYLSTSDIGWLPYLQSWFDQKGMAATITPLLDKYGQRCIDWIVTEGKTALPQTEFSLVKQLCAYVDLLMKKDGTADGGASAGTAAGASAAGAGGTGGQGGASGGVHPEREAEHWFIFACIWAFGGTLCTEGPYLARFDRWWRSEWKALKFPEAGTIFDYCLSPESKKLEKWTETLRKGLSQGRATPGSFVLTTATCAVQYFFDRLVTTRQPILLSGGGGSGKTILVNDRLRHLPETAASQHVTFTYRTSSAVLQQQLQQKLERKMGRRWGPVGRKHLVWVLDDLNTPMVDRFGTQSAIELLRQYMSYSMWHQPARWQPISIGDVQVVGLINPSIGSHHISHRLQRHCVCLQMPAASRDNASLIYSKLLADTIVDTRLERCGKIMEKLVASTLDIHDAVRRDLPQTASKFHYTASLRQLSQIFEGVIVGLPAVSTMYPSLTLSPNGGGRRGTQTQGLSSLATSAAANTASVKEGQTRLVRLWLHEVHRAYCDRLVDHKDAVVLRMIVRRAAEHHLGSVEPTLDAALSQRLLFASFGDSLASVAASGGIDAGGVSSRREYRQVDGIRELVRLVSAQKEDHPRGDTLVVFDDAAEHILRACRALDRPRGHLALIGPQGTGKQTVALLAAHICGFAACAPTEDGGGGGGGGVLAASAAGAVSAHRSSAFREDLGALYVRAGVKGEDLVFVLPDHLLCDSDVLMDLSAVLSAADVTELFSAEEREEVVRKVRSDVRAAMIVDTADNCWEFFTERAHNLLRVAMCFQPGDSLRLRARRFPCLLSCALLDYVHPWDYESLLSVSLQKILKHDLGLPGASDAAGAAGTGKDGAGGGAGAKEGGKDAKDGAGASSGPGGKTPDPRPPSARHQRGATGRTNAGARGGALKEKERRDAKHRKKGDDRTEAVEGQTLQELIVKCLAAVHVEAERAAAAQARRQASAVEVSCRSFVEFVNTYIGMLRERLRDVDGRKRRLEAALLQLHRSQTESVACNDALTRKQQQVADKRSQLEELVSRLELERQVVSVENSKVLAEEAKAAEVQRMLAAKSAELEADAARAEPLASGSNRALESLTKGGLAELRGFKTPPTEVQNVMACVVILLSPPQIVRDKSWTAAQKMMQRADAFLQALRGFKRESVPEAHLTQLRPYLASPDFTAAAVAPRSQAAACLCEWVRGVVQYYELFCHVQPKRDAVQELKLRAEEANIRVAKMRVQVERVQARHAELEAAVQEARGDNENVEAERRDTEARLQLLRRLVASLGPEQVTWANAAEALGATRKHSVGDAVLAAALVTYAGPFAATPRAALLAAWAGILAGSGLAYTEEALLDPVLTLATPAKVAEWATQDLPRDAAAVQNACICTHSRRPVLLLDPQFHGLSWVQRTVKGREDGFEDGAGTGDPGSASAEEQQKKRRVRIQRVDDAARKVALARQGAALKTALLQALPAGDTVVVEQVGGRLEPLLRAVIRRVNGGYSTVSVDDKDVQINPAFRLILHTKQDTPPVPADVRAELTTVDFGVPLAGLEEQLLSLVVSKEKPQLEERRQEVQLRRARDLILLTELEDGMVCNVAEAGTLLLEEELVATLEGMKKQVGELGARLDVAAAAEAEAAEEREEMRPIAQRGALIYNIVSEMAQLERLYRYSLQSFALLYLRTIDVDYTSYVFERGPGGSTDGSAVGDEGADRIQLIVSEMTLAISKHVKRGMRRRHGRVFDLMVCLAIMRQAGVLHPDEDRFFMTWTVQPPRRAAPPTAWLQQEQWDGLLALSQCQRFTDLHVDVEKRLKRWKDWASAERPEEERLPGDARYLGPFERMLIVKVLRPDRLAAAAERFCADLLGAGFVSSPPVSLMELMRDTTRVTPVLFMVPPGSDPLKDLESLAHKMGLSEVGGSLKIVAMGDVPGGTANDALKHCAVAGGWIVLTNMHLAGTYMHGFAEEFEDVLRQAHKDFRVFITAEPSDDPAQHLPLSLVENSVKYMSHQTPQGVQACMMKAWSSFAGDQMESTLKCNEHKRLLFALCYVHAAAVGRRRFGSHGWSRPYAFTTSDLVISSQMLSNYLDPNTTAIPWGDIRYILGDVVYGGHIMDAWDGRALHSLLRCTLNDEFLATGLLAPDFSCPANGTFQQYTAYLENSFPMESPALLHMHPNSEMWRLTEQAKHTVASLHLLSQPLSGAPAPGEPSSPTTAAAAASSSSAVAPPPAAGGAEKADGGTPAAAVAAASEAAAAAAPTQEAALRAVLEDMYARLPANFQVSEGRVVSPVSWFVLQEVGRCNALLDAMRGTLSGCLLGLKGQVTITEDMDACMRDAARNAVPRAFRARAYPWEAGLSAWFADLLKRHEHIGEWAQHLTLPKSVWISGLFSPEGFLAAVLQMHTRKTGVAVDELKIATDVVKKTRDDLTSAPREGAYVFGLCLEGASWNTVAVCSFSFGFCL